MSWIKNSYFLNCWISAYVRLSYFCEGLKGQRQRLETFSQRDFFDNEKFFLACLNESVDHVQRGMGSYGIAVAIDQTGHSCSLPEIVLRTGVPKNIFLEPKRYL